MVMSLGRSFAGQQDYVRASGTGQTRTTRQSSIYGCGKASPWTWSACYAAAVKDTEFGNKDLTTPTTLFLARGKRASATEEDDAGGDPKRRKGHANRTYKGEDRSRKGCDDVYTHSRKDVEFCGLCLYNTDKCGAKQPQGKCKAKRSRQRNRCLGPHQAIACSGGAKKD